MSTEFAKWIDRANEANLYGPVPFIQVWGPSRAPYVSDDGWPAFVRFPSPTNTNLPGAKTLDQAKAMGIVAYRKYLTQELAQLDAAFDEYGELRHQGDEIEEITDED